MDTAKNLSADAASCPAGPPRQKPVRVGVFDTVAGADRAVRGLLEMGFSKERISVVCSDETKERHFREFEHDRPAGSTTGRRALTGSFLGILGGGLVTAAVVATGGVGLVVLGPLLVGGVAGTFIGAMSSRGVEKEVADFYDQALRGGEILVAAEADSDSPDACAELERAERVFRDAGAKPLRLPAG